MGTKAWVDIPIKEASKFCDLTVEGTNIKAIEIMTSEGLVRIRTNWEALLLYRPAPPKMITKYVLRYCILGKEFEELFSNTDKRQGRMREIIDSFVSHIEFIEDEIQVEDCE